MDCKATRVCAGNETSTSRSSCSSSTALFETRTGQGQRIKVEVILYYVFYGLERRKKSRKMRDGRTSETARKIESLCG